MSLEQARGTTRAFDFNIDHQASGRLVIIDLPSTAVVIRVPHQHVGPPTDLDGSTTLEPLGADQDEEPTWEDAEWQ